MRGIGNKFCNKIMNRQKPTDVIFTPPSVAKKMIEMCDIKEGDKVLDPSKGEGVFYNNFPSNCKKDWCEITEGIDFFENNKHYDWIIGNPPYSLWTKWINHTINKCDNFCYIFGIMNFNPSRIHKILEAGFKITALHILQVDWWFSNSFIVLFRKDAEKSIISLNPKRILCEYCGNRCGRGRKNKETGLKNDFNKCTVVKII